MQLSITVPDGSQMATDIANWQDGADYELTVTQTAPNSFELKTAEAAEQEDMGETGAEAPEAPEMPMHKNPAIAAAMSKRMMA